MRILFAVRSYHSHARRTFLTRFVQYGDRDHFTPVVLAHAPGPAYEWFCQQGVEAQLCPLLDQDNAIEPLADLLRQLRIDLVQTEGYHFQLARAARKAQIPHIFRLGAVIQQGIRDYQQSSREAVLAALGHLSQKIVCPSCFIADPLRRSGYDHVEVIYNGVDLQQLRPGPPSLSQGDPLIAMVAHFLPAKRHQDFLRAAAQVSEVHPGARFVIYGEAYDWPQARQYHNKVVACLAELGLEGIVRIETFEEARAAQLEAVDMVVLPSLEEGFSNAVLEAMARARPVIASDSGGNSEMVVADQTGLLVPPTNPEALAKAMLELLANPARARALGQAGRERVEEHYCLKRVIQRYQQSWAECVATSLPK